MRLPSFYMLFIMRMPGWKMNLVVPVPLFVLDELVYIACDLGSLVGRVMNSKSFGGLSVKELVNTLDMAWTTMRSQGSYTLVDVSTEDGVRVAVKML